MLVCVELQLPRCNHCSVLLEVKSRLSVGDMLENSTCIYSTFIIKSLFFAIEDEILYSINGDDSFLG